MGSPRKLASCIPYSLPAPTVQGLVASIPSCERLHGVNEKNLTSESLPHHVLVVKPYVSELSLLFIKWS